MFSAMHLIILPIHVFNFYPTGCWNMFWLRACVCFSAGCWTCVLTTVWLSSWFRFTICWTAVGPCLEACFQQRFKHMLNRVCKRVSNHVLTSCLVVILKSVLNHGSIMFSKTWSVMVSPYVANVLVTVHVKLCFNDVLNHGLIMC